MRMTEEEFEELQRKRGMVAEPAKKPSKYHSKRVYVDGILFDSKKEATYYSELKLRLRAGEIKGFCLQPEFILVPGTEGQKPITYRADFITFYPDDTVEVVDTKGVKTDVFRIKEKLFHSAFPELELKIIK